MKIGDFGLASSSLDFARDEQGKRSERSRKQDDDKRAPVTTDVHTWADSPDRYDYPGIDTPSENPGVLPKDLMDPAETQLTAQARGKEPAETMNIRSDEADRSMLASSDVSLAPDEAFGGTAAVSSRELGGNVLRKGERAPVSEPKKPPGDALKNQARERELANVADIASDEAERSLLGSSDVSLSPDEAFEGSSSNQGQRRPSSLRLPEDAYQNLASGVDAEMNFIESEESRFDMGEELFGSDR